MGAGRATWTATRAAAEALLTTGSPLESNAEYVVVFLNTNAL
jgi:hypothetical protein